MKAYGCFMCGTVGECEDEKLLPDGWKKRERPDHSYFYLCPKCKDSDVDDDYIVTVEIREGVIDEIIDQLVGEGRTETEVQALRDYANRLLDESEPFSKYDLESDVSAFYDGYSQALKEVKAWLWPQFGVATNELRSIYESFCGAFGLPFTEE